jgi:hypothetical protein
MAATQLKFASFLAIEPDIVEEVDFIFVASIYKIHGSIS